ncbi:hypothetical protein FVE85_4044 [Porphyridium purpureum]|uniref:Uncharacterized protein n=1 Tax=Porphyridium purpureum TaxID=35688 RepID=A0A5J4YRF8_PORPP|nr:hypothetical protein FVE85_4044 [Porphyridium purpureum]|eukprot:POR0206..scf229_5
MPFALPVFLLFDNELRGSVLQENLSFDGAGRLAFVHGGSVQVIQCPDVASEMVGRSERPPEMRLDVLNDKRLRERATARSTLVRGAATKSKSSKNSKSKSDKQTTSSVSAVSFPEELERQATSQYQTYERMDGLTALEWWRTKQVHSSSKIEPADRLAIAIDATDKSPAAIVLLANTSPSSSDIKMQIEALFYLKNVSMTGNVIVQRICHLVSLSSVALGNMLFCSTDTGHVMGFSPLPGKHKDQIELSNDVTMGSLGASTSALCCDQLGVPYVAAAAENGNVRIWELEVASQDVITFREIGSIQLKNAPVTCEDPEALIGCAMKMRGGILCIGLLCGVVLVYDLNVLSHERQEPQLLCSMQVHASPVIAMDVHPLADWIVVTGLDCRISLIAFSRELGREPTLVFSVCVTTPCMGVTFCERGLHSPSFYCAFFEMRYIALYRYTAEPATKRVEENGSIA